MKQLTFTFPETATTSTGAPFWSAPKRFPKPLEFTSSDPAYLAFIHAASVLRAEVYGIAVPDWAQSPTRLSDVVNRVKIPEFLPKAGVKIETDEKATTLSTNTIDDEAVIDQLIRTLEEGFKNLPPGFHLNPIQFEKVLAPATFVYPMMSSSRISSNVTPSYAG